MRYGKRKKSKEPRRKLNRVTRAMLFVASLAVRNLDQVTKAVRLFASLTVTRLGVFLLVGW